MRRPGPCSVGSDGARQPPASIVGSPAAVADKSHGPRADGATRPDGATRRAIGWGHSGRMNRDGLRGRYPQSCRPPRPPARPHRAPSRSTARSRTRSGPRSTRSGSDPAPACPASGRWPPTSAWPGSRSRPPTTSSLPRAISSVGSGRARASRPTCRSVRASPARPRSGARGPDRPRRARYDLRPGALPSDGVPGGFPMAAWEVRLRAGLASGGAASRRRSAAARPISGPRSARISTPRAATRTDPSRIVVGSGPRVLIAALVAALDAEGGSDRIPVLGLSSRSTRRSGPSHGGAARPRSTCRRLARRSMPPRA